MRARALVWRRHHPFRPSWVDTLWLALAALVLLTAVGCRSGAPILDTGVPPADADATISGTVRGADAGTALDGRPVEVVNLDTHERLRATTNRAGGFSFKVRPGKYRVELTLRPGETIVERPGVMHVNRSDADAHADFLVASAGASGRSAPPRSPASRVDPGLGSPMA